MSKQLSISDDDVCASCIHCQYNPGDLSTCSKGFPGSSAGGDYIELCAEHTEARVFTVTLLYPDYIAGTYGETWMGSVRVAYTPGDAPAAVKAAVAAARAECVEQFAQDDVSDHQDLAVVSVIEGDHEDLRHMADN